MDLPSQPRWLDVLPRLCSGAALDKAAMQYCVRVPGGQVVAAMVSEALAREFVTWLGQEYVDRADTTMRALDEIAETIGPVQGRQAEMLADGVQARKVFESLEPKGTRLEDKRVCKAPAVNHPWRRGLAE